MVSVLVVDDSAVARRLITHIVSGHPDLQVVGEAGDGAEAIRLVRELEPDVVTMDIRMPVMDGYEATAAIMASSPKPIVMVSAHEPAEIARSFRAIDAGAMMVLRKPVGLGAAGGDAIAAELVDAIRSVSGLKMVTRRPRPDSATPELPGAVNARPRAHRVEIVAIAASTGGPAAVGAIVRSLPPDLAVPVVLLQHIADGFDGGFASYLDSVSPLAVRLARSGERPEPGQVLLAPNGTHLTLTRSRQIRLVADLPVGGHRPSATPMFRTIGDAYGPSGLGIILTGIGRDGCDGLAAMHRAGGRIIAQDEDSSVVWGMPRAVVEAGLADEVLPIDQIAGAIMRACRRGRHAASPAASGSAG